MAADAEASADTADEAAETAEAASTTTPVAFALASAYPNPFSTSLSLGFETPETAQVRLVVYDVLGRAVATLVDDEVEAGRHTARLDAADLPSGTYLVRLTAGAFAETQRVTLVR